MNDVVVMVERNRRNKLTANFSVTKDFKISAQICSGNLYPTENTFFVEVRGLKNFLIGIGIGLKQRSGLRD